DIPLDGIPGARNRIRMEPRRERIGGIKNPSKGGVCTIRISPVHRAKVSKRVLALHLHDVDLPAGRPSNRTDAVAEHPKCRPDTLTFGRVDAGLDPGVYAE